MAILDEAQRIKNPSSQAHLAASLIRRSASWALTGTPIENSSTDLRSIADFILPGLDLPEDSAQLAQVLAPYVLRRTRRQVFGDEAPTLRRTMRVTLTADQQASYDRALSRSRDAGYPKSEAASLLAAITRLKQICNYDRPSGRGYAEARGPEIGGRGCHRGRWKAACVLPIRGHARLAVRTGLVSLGWDASRCAINERAFRSCPPFRRGGTGKPVVRVSSRRGRRP